MLFAAKLPCHQISSRRITRAAEGQEKLTCTPPTLNSFTLPYNVCFPCVSIRRKSMLTNAARINPPDA